VLSNLISSSTSVLLQSQVSLTDWRALGIPELRGPALALRRHAAIRDVHKAALDLDRFGKALRFQSRLRVEILDTFELLLFTFPATIRASARAKQQLA
jgi:hypothetical protein